MWVRITILEDNSGFQWAWNSCWNLLAGNDNNGYDNMVVDNTNELSPLKPLTATTCDKIGEKVVATIGSSCIFNASKSWYCWSYTWKGLALSFTSVDCHSFQFSSTEYNYEAWTEESHNSRLGKGLNNSLMWCLWDSSWFVCKIRRQIMKLQGAFIIYLQLLNHWRKGHQGQRGVSKVLFWYKMRPPFI
jgi:hypothetical protein